MTESPIHGQPPTIAEAHRILKQFDCRDRITPDSEKSSIRAALLVAAQHSDYQILGICAENLEQGRAALHAYANALGYSIDPSKSLPAIEAGIYLKFNPKTGLLHGDTYSGDYRGVLVACQSSYPDQINELYGHLPLDLFTEIPSAEHAAD